MLTRAPVPRSTQHHSKVTSAVITVECTLELSAGLRSHLIFTRTLEMIKDIITIPRLKRRKLRLRGSHFVQRSNFKSGRVTKNPRRLMPREPVSCTAMLFLTQIRKHVQFLWWPQAINLD